MVLGRSGSSWTASFQVSRARVAVEVLTEDDMNSAVTGDLGYGSYVITTSNAPVKNGDLVRLAD